MRLMVIILFSRDEKYYSMADSKREKDVLPMATILPEVWDASVALFVPLGTWFPFSLIDLLSISI